MDVGEVKKLDAYLKRLFGNARIHVVPTKADAADVFVGAERIRVVPRLRKKDSAEVYVGDEYIGVLFFDEKDARSSVFELPILALDLDEPGLLKE